MEPPKSSQKGIGSYLSPGVDVPSQPKVRRRRTVVSLRTLSLRGGLHFLEANLSIGISSQSSSVLRRRHSGPFSRSNLTRNRCASIFVSSRSVRVTL